MIFVDTSAWLALIDERDGNHASARRFQSELARGRYGQLVTTDYVLDESASYVKRRAGDDALVQFRHAVERSDSVRVIWTTPESFWGAWSRLEARGDKAWSLTDCVSFLTMESLAIRNAFGYDSAFEQAGFKLLPSDHA